MEAIHLEKCEGDRKRRCFVEVRRDLSAALDEDDGAYRIFAGADDCRSLAIAAAESAGYYLIPTPEKLPLLC